MTGRSSRAGDRGRDEQVRRDHRAAVEEGAAAVLLLAPLLVAAVLLAVVVVAGSGLLLADGRARDAVDGAAVAAVHAVLSGRTPPCDAAREAAVAATDRARVVVCDVGSTGQVTVEVVVLIPSALARVLRVDQRRATAVAAPRW